MRDPGEQIARLRGHIKESWSDERAVRVALAMKGRGRRRAAASRAALAVLLLVVIGVALRLRRGGDQAELTAAEIRLRDGSLVRPLPPGGRVRVVHETADETLVELLARSARFEVAPQRGRTFRVLAGPVQVVVIGTAFTVTREGSRARVEVERGRVRVRWPDGARELGAAEAGEFPPSAADPPAPHGATPPPSSAPPSDSPSRPGAAPSSAAPSAATSSRAVSPGAAPPTPTQLMDDADEARRRAQPQRALALLEQIIRGHRRDPSAPIAAFKMGRIMLEDLGRFEAAAAHFARSRELGPASALAEDALAREVESWSRAGKPDKVWERAEQYLRKYPKGAWAPMVRKLGGMD